jgi:signal peptidase I
MKFLKAIITFLMEIMETIVFIGSLFIAVYMFILQPNQIKGVSMEPTFFDKEYIFTSKFTYKIRDPQRGDVVVFHSPKNPDIEYIKRVIGLPGDTILISGPKVFVNGSLINEPYISAPTQLLPNNFVKENEPVTVSLGEIFVMGDNRPRSADSREFGPIPISSVVGHVFYRYFPANRVGNINNPFKDDFRS